MKRRRRPEPVMPTLKALLAMSRQRAVNVFMIVFAILFIAVPAASAANGAFSTSTLPASGATVQNGQLATVIPMGIEDRPPREVYENLVELRAENGGNFRGICTELEGTGITGREYLPVNRWSNETNFETRFGDKAWNDVVDKFARNGIVENLFTVGNTIWSMTASLLESSMSACFVDQAGGAMDSIAGKISGAIFESGIVALIFALVLVAWAFRVFKGSGGSATFLLKKVGILALIIFMTVGAYNSKGGGAEKNPNADFQPGVGSPGWFTTTIDYGVTSFTSSIVGILGVKTTGGLGEAKDVMHCDTYVAGLKAAYREQYGSSVSRNAANIPLLISSMWEESSIRSFNNAQFGPDNIHGERVYCRVLDYINGVSADQQALSMIEMSEALNNTKGVTGTYKVEVPDNPEQGFPFSLSVEDDHRDRMWVAWAACIPEDSKYAVDFSSKSRAQDTIKRAEKRLLDREGSDPCADPFWDDDHELNDDFNWGDGEDTIQNEASGDERAFLLSLHGFNNGGATGVGLGFVIGAIMSFIVFAGFAIVIFFAKVVALVMIMMAILAAFAALLPSNDINGLVKFSKSYLNMSFLSFGAQLILAVIAILTKALVDTGSAIFGTSGSSLIGVLWIGIAPLLAVIAMRYIFKQMKTPSPLSLAGAKAWVGSGMTGNALRSAQHSLVDNFMDDRYFGKRREKARAAANGTRPNGVDGANEMAPKAEPGDGPVEDDETTTSTEAGGGAGGGEGPDGDGPEFDDEGSPDGDGPGGADPDTEGDGGEGEGSGDDSGDEIPAEETETVEEPAGAAPVDTADRTSEMDPVGSGETSSENKEKVVEPDGDIEAEDGAGDDTNDPAEERDQEVKPDVVPLTAQEKRDRAELARLQQEKAEKDWASGKDQKSKLGWKTALTNPAAVLSNEMKAARGRAEAKTFTDAQKDIRTAADTRAKQARRAVAVEKFKQKPISTGLSMAGTGIKSAASTAKTSVATAAGGAKTVAKVGIVGGAMIGAGPIGWAVAGGYAARKVHQARQNQDKTPEAKAAAADRAKAFAEMQRRQQEQQRPSRRPNRTEAAPEPQPTGGPTSGPAPQPTPQPTPEPLVEPTGGPAGGGKPEPQPEPMAEPAPAPTGGPQGPSPSM